MSVESGAAIEHHAPRQSSEWDSSRNRGSAERLAAVVFFVWIAAAGPLILFHLGTYRWFFSDDWFFITNGQAGSLHDLFVPHNAHWSTVPFLLYRVLWHAAGLHSYVPYQVWTLAAHLTIAILLRLIMRRAGVGPWLATVAAGSFVLYGPGSDNIIWAFQVGFTAALMLGLAQLLLADHDGRIDTATGSDLVPESSLMCSGVGVTMAIVVFIAIWLRHGVDVRAISCRSARPRVHLLGVGRAPTSLEPLRTSYRWHDLAMDMEFPLVAERSKGSAISAPWRWDSQVFWSQDSSRRGLVRHLKHRGAGAG